jgi:hypothetical protein
MNHNDDGILIQPLERSTELPVRPSAEQAVKAPLQQLQGSVGSAKRDKDSKSPFWLNFPKFHQQNQSESDELCRRQENDVRQQNSAHCLNFSKLC